MTTASPAVALARSLQDKLGTADLTNPAVLAAVEGVLRELGSQYCARIAELEVEIARRDSVDRYRQAFAQAGAILHDQPEVLAHADLAADMILCGVPPAEVRVRMLDTRLVH